MRQSASSLIAARACNALRFPCVYRFDPIDASFSHFVNTSRCAVGRFPPPFNGEFAMKRSGSIAALGAMTIAALACAPASFAADGNSQVDGIAVRFAQESFDNPESVAKVYDKLKRASRKACGLGGGFLNMSERTVANRCYERTLADVVSKINRPLLTSVHDSKASEIG
jgi:UrcA family protein